MRNRRLLVERLETRTLMSVLPLVAKLTVSGGSFTPSYPIPAISGNTVVRLGRDSAFNMAAFVFTKPASGWANATQVAELTASDSNPYFADGAVAISGNTIVVGAFPTFGGQGTFYVFSEPATGWKNMTQTAEIIGPAQDPTFSNSLAISGNTIVDGSYGATANGTEHEGAAYVYAEPASGWANMAPTAILTASDGGRGTSFGLDVAIDGNTIAVRAQEAAYVYTKPASGWTSMTQTGKLTIIGGGQGDIAISGDTVVLGGAYNGAATGVGGSTYVYTEPASGWTNMTPTATLTIPSSVSNEIMTSLSISGNTIVTREAAPLSSFAGAVDVFTKPAAGWVNMTEPTYTIPPTAQSGPSSASVVSGNTVVLSCPGAVNVYALPATTATTVTAVSSTTKAGNYQAAAIISITVTFSGPVTVIGTPQLRLSDGEMATYVSGSGTSTLTFNYTVKAKDSTRDLDYASTAALSGTIQDATGNAAVLSLPAIGTDGLAKKKIVIGRLDSLYWLLGR